MKGLVIAFLLCVSTLCLYIFAPPEIRKEVFSRRNVLLLIGACVIWLSLMTFAVVQANFSLNLF